VVYRYVIMWYMIRHFIYMSVTNKNNFREGENKLCFCQRLELSVDDVHSQGKGHYADKGEEVL